MKVVMVSSSTLTIGGVFFFLEFVIDTGGGVGVSGNTICEGEFDNDDSDNVIGDWGLEEGGDKGTTEAYWRGACKNAVKEKGRLLGLSISKKRTWYPYKMLLVTNKQLAPKNAEKKVQRKKRKRSNLQQQQRTYCLLPLVCGAFVTPVFPRVAKKELRGFEGSRQIKTPEVYGGETKKNGWIT